MYENIGAPPVGHSHVICFHMSASFVDLIVSDIKGPFHGYDVFSMLYVIPGRTK